MADNRVLPVLPTSFTRLVNIDAPIVQAPIGRLATPRIAAAVSNAGALGMLALSWTDPQDVPPAIHELRLVTNRPFGINLILEWPQHDRPKSGSLCRHWLSLEGDVVALQGLAEPSRPSVRAGQATEVAGRRGPSRFRGPVAAGEQDQEARERADVLVVVADDRGERFGGSTTQETEISPGDLGPVDVAVADHPQQT